MCWLTRARSSPPTISTSSWAIGRTRCAPNWETSATISSSRSRWAPGTRCCNWPPALKDYQGNLLILYGDTPLFRPASIRGLLNRHALRQAHLTLLTAIVRTGLCPTAASFAMPGGASWTSSRRRRRRPPCAKSTNSTWARISSPRRRSLPRWSKLPPAQNGKYQLTDCVHQLIRSGLRVESYQICDPDEIQGINTPQDLEQAEFILQKRLFRPRREEEQNQVVVWHRRLAGDHRGGVHAPQRPALVAGARQ